MKNNNIITIDGPSASGKGSLAKALAKELDFILLDSGLLYRAYSYCFEQTQTHAAARDLFSDLRVESVNHEMHVFENNQDITSILRHENIAKSASQLSSLQETRDNLMSFQRDLASYHGAASKKEIHSMTNLCIQNLDEINFFKPKEKKPIMLENLRNIFYRMELSAKETRILAGVFASLGKKR